jgi:peptide/nickel transport system substrate-binding protein
MHMPRPRGLLVLLLASILVACAAPPPSPSAGGQAPSEPAAPSQPTGPKRIVTAVVGQPSVWVERLRSGPRIGAWNLYELTTAGMTLIDAQGDLQPQLAEAVPSLENGLWKLLPDGTMETTWKLRPNLTWHDGAPLTSADVVFTAQLDQDRDLPFLRAAPYSAVDTVEAPDPQTVLVRWKRPYIDADRLFTRSYASLVPKHLLEGPYTADKSKLVDQPYWSSDYVGAGPYKIQSFDRSGGPIILQAFDGYALGRPKIDEIEVRPFAAADALMVGVLAGSVDVTLGSPGLSIDQAIEIANQWRDGHVERTPYDWVPMHPQLLTPSPSVVGNAEFRKAMMYALDRQGIAESLSNGWGQKADSFMNPNQPQYREIEARIIKYEYDPRKAATMLEGLGYAKGPDGIYRDGTGQQLAVELRSLAGSQLPYRSAVADQWRTLGVAVEELTIPPQRANDTEYRATFPAFEVLPQPNDLAGLPLLHSRFTRLPENNFSGGNNWSRMMDPQFDALLDRWQATIPKAERIQVLGQILYEISDRLNVMPLAYGVRPIVISNRMQGVGVGVSIEASQAWNVHAWDVR